MTNEELISKIKAEIERLKATNPSEYAYQNAEGYIWALDDVLSFISTLESETTYDTQQYTPRPSVGIDDVARVQFASHAKVFDKKRKAVFDWEQFKEVAGIFYGFGKKDHSDILESEKPINPDDAMKALDEKIALVKQRGTWDGVDVDKYMDEVRGREPEKPMNQDELEKAVVDYFEGYWPGMETAEQCNTDLRFTPPAIMRLARHFAQWGADHTPLPEDTVLFNKGVAEGKRLMMEEAVEGEFLYTPYSTIALDDLKDYNFKDNQKVRIIIV